LALWSLTIGEGWSMPAFVRIVLQNSQNAVRLIFREKTKQATIADRCALERTNEVAGRFIAN
jgi:hypothetical protein